MHAPLYIDICLLLSRSSFLTHHHHPSSSCVYVYIICHISVTTCRRIDTVVDFSCARIYTLQMTTVMLRPKKPGVRGNANNNNNNNNKYARYSVFDELRPCRNRYGKSYGYIFMFSYPMKVIM